MSPRFLPPPPPPSYLPFPSCFYIFFLRLFHFCPLWESKKNKIKWHMHLHSLFLHPFLHLQMRRGTNASFPSRCIWHGDSPSSAEQNDSTPLSLCQRGCCYLPRRWKWGIFTFVGEDRRTGNEPMGIMHWSSTFFFLQITWSCSRSQRRRRKQPRPCICLVLEDI